MVDNGMEDIRATIDIERSIDDQINREQSTQVQTTDVVENFIITPVNSNPRKRSIVDSRNVYRKRTKTANNEYLKDLLERHNFGKALKIEYQRNQCLSDKSSILLCDIIASDLIVGNDR